jgi:hypothetical protein
MSEQNRRDAAQDQNTEENDTHRLSTKARLGITAATLAALAGSGAALTAAQSNPHEESSPVSSSAGASSAAEFNREHSDPVPDFVLPPPYVNPHIVEPSAHKLSSDKGGRVEVDFGLDLQVNPDNLKPEVEAEEADLMYEPQVGIVRNSSQFNHGRGETMGKGPVPKEEQPNESVVHDRIILSPSDFENGGKADIDVFARSSSHPPNDYSEQTFENQYAGTLEVDRDGGMHVKAFMDPDGHDTTRHVQLSPDTPVPLPSEATSIPTLPPVTPTN